MDKESKAIKELLDLLLNSTIDDAKELLKEYLEESYADLDSDSYEEGLDQGYKDCMNEDRVSEESLYDSFDRGYDEGYNYGYDEGHSQGYDKGYNYGYDEGDSHGLAERRTRLVQLHSEEEGDIRIEIYQDGWTSGLQLSIGNGRGGYRIAGPKFNGSGKLLLSKKLDERDVVEIREYLDIFPNPQATPSRKENE